MTHTTRTTVQGLHALRHELITTALAARPLPAVPADGPALMLLPGTVRRALGRLPHLAVGAVAAVLFWLSQTLYWNAYSSHWGNGPSLSLLLGLAAAVPLVLVLFRPIAAWWLSLAGICVVAASGVSIDPFPFAETTFVSHLAVMVLAALRSRPSVAGAMWLSTFAVGSAVVRLTGRVDDNLAVFAIWSAIALTGAIVVRDWWDARRRAAAGHGAVLAERSKRTVLEERTTIARELHDVVAHHMSVIAIQAEAAPYRVADIPPELAASFATIRENAVAALSELRRILGVIRVSDYGDYDGPEAPQPTLAALDALLANVREAGLPVEMVMTGARRELPQGVELSAYRIIQEALSNALRHAPGAGTRVELAYVLGGLGVRVVNGPTGSTGSTGPTGPGAAGPVPGAAAGPVPGGRGSGHGITGMRERVAMLDGEMTAGPTEDGGYEVTVFLPAPALAEQPAAVEENA